MIRKQLRTLVFVSSLLCNAFLDAHQTSPINYWAPVIKACKQEGDVIVAFNACLPEEINKIRESIQSQHALADNIVKRTDQRARAKRRAHKEEINQLTNQTIRTALHLTALETDYEKQHDLVEYYKQMNPEDLKALYKDLCSIYSAVTPNIVREAQKAANAAIYGVWCYISQTRPDTTRPAEPNSNLIELLTYDIAAIETIDSTLFKRTVTVHNWQPYYFDMYVNRFKNGDCTPIEEEWARLDARVLAKTLLGEPQKRLHEELIAVQTARGTRALQEHLEKKDANALQAYLDMYTTLINTIESCPEAQNLEKQKDLFTLKKAAVEQAIAKAAEKEVLAKAQEQEAQRKLQEAQDARRRLQEAEDARRTLENDAKIGAKLIPLMRKYAPATVLAAFAGAGVVYALYKKYTQENEFEPEDENAFSMHK